MTTTQLYIEETVLHNDVRYTRVFLSRQGEDDEVHWYVDVPHEVIPVSDERYHDLEAAWQQREQEQHSAKIIPISS